jgi:hypothetical protein
MILQQRVFYKHHIDDNPSARKKNHLGNEAGDFGLKKEESEIKTLISSEVGFNVNEVLRLIIALYYYIIILYNKDDILFYLIHLYLVGSLK